MNFVKYPRTPHLFGSMGTDDDKHLDEADSARFIADASLIVEEKIDGTNVGIHFTSEGEMVLQCRGHLITEGMHPQYDLFKQWTVVKRFVLEQRLEDRFILFGEWMYARHSITIGSFRITSSSSTSSIKRQRPFSASSSGKRCSKALEFRPCRCSTPEPSAESSLSS